MDFSTNDYLNWYIPMLKTAESAINLHSSGAPAFNFDTVEPDKSSSPWDRFTKLEAKLASRLGIPKDEVCLALGATGGTLLALLALEGRGSEILVEAPIYEPMLRQSERLANVKRFTCKMADGWALPLGEIEDLITDETSHVLITEPSNPSGTFRNREDILALADIAERHSAIILINEVYRGYSVAPSFHGQRDNIVVVSSFSKLVGFYGLRFGWLSGRKEIVKKLKTSHLNMTMPPQPLASYGLALFDQIDRLRDEIVKVAKKGLLVVDSWVNAAEGVSWLKPEGPGFGCVVLPERHADDLRFTQGLYEKRDVLVIPGSFFEVPGAIRLSWLQAGDRLEQGLESISSLLK